MFDWTGCFLNREGTLLQLTELGEVDEDVQKFMEKGAKKLQRAQELRLEEEKKKERETSETPAEPPKTPPYSKRTVEQGPFGKSEVRTSAAAAAASAKESKAETAGESGERDIILKHMAKLDTAVVGGARALDEVRQEFRKKFKKEKKLEEFIEAGKQVFLPFLFPNKRYFHLDLIKRGPQVMFQMESAETLKIYDKSFRFVEDICEVNELNAEIQQKENQMVFHQRL